MLVIAELRPMASSELSCIGRAASLLGKVQGRQPWRSHRATSGAW